MISKLTFFDLRAKKQFARTALYITVGIALSACDPFNAVSVKHDLQSCWSVSVSRLNNEQTKDILKAIDPIAKGYGLSRNACGEERPYPDFPGRYLACYKGATKQSPFFDIVAIEQYKPESIQIVIYGWSSQIRAHSQEALRHFEEAMRRSTAPWSCS